MADRTVVTAPGHVAQPDLRTRLLAQKTLLISELAEAVDNQFNNIMMSVTSYAELELKKASPSAQRSLQQVLNNAGRATQLIQKLLAFSRTRTSVARLIDVNEVVKGIDELLHQLVGERIDVVVELQPNLPKITADPIDLEALLLTLAVHARNAISASGGFTLCSNAITVEHHSAMQDKLTPGKYVTLSVSDSGTQTLPADPHTAAAQDLRISLTLAAIHEIVKEANGLLRIASRPEQGTTFTIYLPAEENGVSIPAAEGVSERPSSQAKTILVVEDDDAVRVPAAEFLKMEGFKVPASQVGSGSNQRCIAKAFADRLVDQRYCDAGDGRSPGR